MSTARFYDGLADTYHALYPDWRSAGRAQAEALHRLLSRWHPGPADIADVACGIGTQLIGLAEFGHRVIGSDISARAVGRARRECAAAGVHTGLLTADMRNLPLDDSCADVIICADNALPHLLADSDVLAALAQTQFFQPVMTAHSPARSAALMREGSRLSFLANPISRSSPSSHPLSAWTAAQSVVSSAATAASNRRSPRLIGCSASIT
jgi:SAM-dependent methyltransferase